MRIGAGKQIGDSREGVGSSIDLKGLHGLWRGRAVWALTACMQGQRRAVCGGARPGAGAAAALGRELERLHVEHFYWLSVA